MEDLGKDPFGLNWEELLDKVQDQKNQLQKYKEDAEKNGLKDPKKAKEHLNNIRKNVDDANRRLENLFKQKEKVDNNWKQVRDHILDQEKEEGYPIYTTNPFIATLIGVEVSKERLCKKCGLPISEETKNEDGDYRCEACWTKYEESEE